MTEITAINAKTLTRELTTPFEISLGTQMSISNVAIQIELENGTVGIGEAAPITTVTHETQQTVLAAVDTAVSLITGMNVENTRGVHESLKIILRHNMPHAPGLKLQYSTHLGSYGGVHSLS
jgi:L-Ala-D/L-Glu epimerase